MCRGQFHWLSDESRMRAMKAGAVGFLTKPCNADHLIGYLDKALTGSSGM